MKPGYDNVIGVGLWVEGRGGRWHLIDPGNWKSWLRFPFLTLGEWRENR